MNKYRIYALIHGQTLPQGEIFGCEIRKMSFREQSKRGFSPIQAVFSEDEMTNHHKTYVTSLLYVDPIRIKSKYIIIHDTEKRADWHYRFSEIYPLFKYRYDYKAVKPHTSVLSNLVDLKDFKICR